MPFSTVLGIGLGRTCRPLSSMEEVVGKSHNPLLFYIGIIYNW